MKTLITLLALSLGILFANPSARLELSPTQLDFGTLSQGQTKNFTFELKNISKDTLRLEAPFAQGIGPQNIKSPQVIAPGQTAPWSFEYHSAYLNGLIKENITFVVADDEYYSLEISGKVESPITISPATIDLGYLQKKVIVKNFYLFASQKKLNQIELKKSINGIKITSTPVKLTKNQGELSESEDGKPGLKIELTFDPMQVLKDPKWAHRNSVNLLVEFYSKDFPEATPEIQLVGYRQDQ